MSIKYRLEGPGGPLTEWQESNVFDLNEIPGAREAEWLRMGCQVENETNPVFEVQPVIVGGGELKGIVDRGN